MGTEAIKMNRIDIGIITELLKIEDQNKEIIDLLKKIYEKTKII